MLYNRPSWSGATASGTLREGRVLEPKSLSAASPFFRVFGVVAGRLHFGDRGAVKVRFAEVVLALACAFVAATFGIARADMGEVTVYNWQQNDTPLLVVPGPLCTLHGTHAPSSVAVRAIIALDCDAVLEHDASPVTLFLVEPENDRTSLCSVRWDGDGIFVVEAGLVCRYREADAADITVFTPP